MKNLLKKAFLLLALVGGASNAWATTKTFSLVSYTVTDGKYTVTDGATLTLGRTSGNIGGPASSSRGFRWQSNMYFQIVVPSGQKVTSVTLTSNSQGNSVNDITYTLTDGTNNLSGSWDHAPNSGKQATYTWTVTTGMSYGTWKLTNTGSTGDLYISQVAVTYETASTTNTAPSIVTQPTSSVTTYVGHETSLTVAASGYPAPTYQWYSCDDAEKTNAAAIGGATNATYTFTPASTGTYYYFCRATNNYDASDHTADSDVSTVTVSQLHTVTYSLGEVTGTEGKVPDAEEVTSTVTIPVNKTLYKAGNTLTAWNDGSANHALGSTFDVSTDVELTPVFTANGANAHLGYNATTVTWDFQTKNGAPTWQLEGNTGVQVAQTTVGGSSIDVKVNIDATNGKLNNASWTDWAQFTPGTKLTVPVLNGAVVKLYTYNEGSGTTFGGNPADSYASNIHTYTATADGDLEVVAGSGVDYVRYISVTYPSETEVLTVSANDTKIGLTKANINAVDYLSVTADKWVTGKTFAGYSGDFFNMTSTDRELSIKVTGASYFEAFVRNDNGSNDRSFKLKVGTAEDVTVAAPRSTLVATGVYALDPSVTTTITLKGTGDAVYPVYFHFNPTVPVTITEAGWATLYTDKALDFTGTGLTAYTATCSESVVTLAPVDNVPANTGVVLKGAAKDYDIPVIASSSTDKGNLRGSATEPTAYNAFDGFTLYVLTSVNEGANVQFNPVTSGSIAAGKAYLEIKGGTSYGRSMEVVFADDILTGINEAKAEVKAPKEGKFFENGKLVIFKKGMKFNANGARIY